MILTPLNYSWIEYILLYWINFESIISVDILYFPFSSLFLSINIFNHFYAKSTKLGNMETKIYETSQTDSKLNGLNENKIISSLDEMVLRHTSWERYWDNAVNFLYHSLLNTWICGLVPQGWFWPQEGRGVHFLQINLGKSVFWN